LHVAEIRVHSGRHPLDGRGVIGVADDKGRGHQCMHRR
jgi:hypothetical protein